MDKMENKKYKEVYILLYSQLSPVKVLESWIQLQKYGFDDLLYIYFN